MKNKFGLCFRPVIIETEEISDVNYYAVPKDIVVAKVKKNNGGAMAPPSIMMSPLLFKSTTSGGSGTTVQIPSFDRPENHSRKTLSRVLKTILFESSQPRIRVQGGNIREIKLPEETNDLEERKTQLEKVEDHKRRKIIDDANIISEENKAIPSTTSSSSSSPSSSDQSSKDLKSLSMRRSLARSRSNPSSDKKKKAKTTKTNDKALDSASLLSSNSDQDHKDMVLYWMVLALLATILWGKIFAMLLATLWLYYIPRRKWPSSAYPTGK